MRVDYQNNETDKEDCFCDMQNKVNPKEILDKISINITILFSKTSVYYIYFMKMNEYNLYREKTLDLTYNNPET